MIIEFRPPEKPKAIEAEEPPDNVVRPNFGQQSELIERPGFCRHHSYQLHERQREVRCGACGALLDAFQVLLDYAEGERRWRGWDAESREKNRQLKELRDEERKIKARLKNASRKEATAAVAEERARSQRERIEISEKARDIAGLCRRIEQIARRGGTP